MTKMNVKMYSTVKSPPEKGNSPINVCHTAPLCHPLYQDIGLQNTLYVSIPYAMRSEVSKLVTGVRSVSTRCPNLMGGEGWSGGDTMMPSNLLQPSKLRKCELDNDKNCPKC